MMDDPAANHQPRPMADAGGVSHSQPPASAASTSSQQPPSAAVAQAPPPAPTAALATGSQFSVHTAPIGRAAGGNGNAAGGQQQQPAPAVAKKKRVRPPRRKPAVAKAASGGAPQQQPQAAVQQSAVHQAPLHNMPPQANNAPSQPHLQNMGRQQGTGNDVQPVAGGGAHTAQQHAAGFGASATQQQQQAAQRPQQGWRPSASVSSRPAASKRPAQKKKTAEQIKMDEKQRYYGRKHLLLKKATRALVFKNAALCDEVARLQQRIATTKEDIRTIIKRLIHVERLKQRREANALKRQQAAMAAAGHSHSCTVPSASPSSHCASLMQIAAAPLQMDQPPQAHAL